MAIKRCLVIWGQSAQVKILLFAQLRAERVKGKGKVEIWSNEPLITDRLSFYSSHKQNMQNNWVEKHDVFNHTFLFFLPSNFSLLELFSLLFFFHLKLFNRFFSCAFKSNLFFPTKQQSELPLGGKIPFYSEKRSNTGQRWWKGGQQNKKKR